MSLGLENLKHNNVVGVVVDDLQEALPGASLRLDFGELIGIDTRKLLRIPIISDAVLAKSNDICFIEGVPGDLPNEFTEDLVISALPHWKVTARVESQVLYLYLDDDQTVVVEKLTERQNTVIRVSRLVEIFIMRGRADFHTRITANTHQSAPNKTDVLASLEIPTMMTDEGEGAPISRAVLKDFRIFEFQSSRAAPQLPKWEVIISRAIGLPPPVSLMQARDPAWLLEQQDLGDSRVTLTLKADEDAFNAALKNPALLQRLVTELLSNGNALGSKLDVAFSQRTPSLDKWYFPSLFGDIAASTRTHYNLKQKHGMVPAKKSPIEILRKLNNEVKRLLIYEFVPMGSSVLDLACGHAQDLDKYAEKNLREFTGVDISKKEIEEANIRAAKRKVTYCNFKVGNLLQDKIYEELGETKFDVVSIQLAIHYCVENPNQATGLLRRINNHMKIGGVFIGSTGCCEIIAERLKDCNVELNSESELPPKMKAVNFGNRVYKVKFCAEEIEKAAGEQLKLLVDNENEAKLSFDETQLRKNLNWTWGIKYSFWLEGHIDAEEFVMPWEAFVKMAESLGFKLLLHQNFKQYFQTHLEKKTDEAERFYTNMKGRGKPDPDQLNYQFEAFQFYKVFAFSKIADAPPPTKRGSALSSSHVSASSLTVLNPMAPDSAFPMLVQPPQYMPQPYVQQPYMYLQQQFVPQQYQPQQPNPMEEDDNYISSEEDSSSVSSSKS